MCSHGDEVLCTVTVDARDSHTGEVRQAQKGIDRCLAPLVDALNAAGITTRSSCCGHGKAQAVIHLSDDRILEIRNAAGDLPHHMREVATDYEFAREGAPRDHPDATGASRTSLVTEAMRARARDPRNRCVAVHHPEHPVDAITCPDCAHLILACALEDDT